MFGLMIFLTLASGGKQILEFRTLLLGYIIQ
jgi:hypothetical protein